ncbi:hypothetical protein ATB98_00070 [Sinorhizobium saheli]|jgi:hypothetical protein|uniref:Uncharacterized protein n=1 Tax=Sinorhizobium saheli TaxID=36856 RepID=A0A178YA27_SINSA|nr:hypothetical protein ATB98_00070 [Sinorhizobium saheli]
MEGLHLGGNRDRRPAFSECAARIRLQREPGTGFFLAEAAMAASKDQSAPSTSAETKAKAAAIAIEWGMRLRAPREE